MFSKLKEKLKSWIGKSKQEIEETAPKKATSEEDTSKSSISKELKSQKSWISEKPLGVLDNKKPLKKQIIKKVKQEIKEIEQEPEKPLDALDKDPIEILSEKSPKEVNEILEEKLDETAQEVKERIKEIKEEEIKQEPEKKSFFKRLKSSFSYQITPEEFNKIFDELEMLLLENNVALEVTEDLKEKLSKQLIGQEIKKEELENKIKLELKKSLNEILIEPDDPLDIIKLSNKKPFVILFFGINGTGKTTTLAKITNLLQKNKLSVVLAAADTFRAASIEQIQIHADKLKVPLIKHDYGADPSAVGFDAIKYAKKHKIDVVLIDTAGRMHTKTNLLAEMEKICRVTNPDLKIFVAESIAGNDATEQAKSFHEMIEIDGSILSKVDIDEKGGTIISVSYATHKPIFYLGTGQEYKDLKLFDKQKFIEDLGLSKKQCATHT